MIQEFIRHPTAFLGIEYQQSMEKKINLVKVIVLSLLLLNCAADIEQRAVEYAVKGGNEISAEVLGKWNRSCALCHINGEAGAPIIGDTDSWVGAALTVCFDVLRTGAGLVHYLNRASGFACRGASPLGPPDGPYCADPHKPRSAWSFSLRPA